MDTVRVAAISLSTIDGQPEANYARAFAMCRVASAQAHPRVILLPEAFAAGYCGTDLSPFAEDVPGPTVDTFVALAGETGAIICFGILEKAPKGVYNSAVVVDRTGILGIQRKTHLYYDANRPYRHEAALLLPGQTLDPIDTAIGRVGVLICYESTFPENWRVLALKGARFLLMPYNCEGDSLSVVSHLPAANVIPAVGANRTGTVYQGERWMANMGTAFAMDETGKVLGHTAAGVEDILIVDIDLQRARAARRQSFQAGTYHNRRPDLYSVLTETTRLPD